MNKKRIKSWCYLAVGVFVSSQFLLSIYVSLGRTTADLWDYADTRFQGHTRLELVSKPLINGFRFIFSDEAHTDKLKRLQEFKSLRYKSTSLSAHGSVVVRTDSSTFEFPTIREAAKFAPSGSTVDIPAGIYVDDVAIWEQDNILIRSIGGVAKLHSNGKTAEGKAIWVFRTKSAVVQGFMFSGARVSDLNGAGIRLERGHLQVLDCEFVNNESGILTVGNDDIELQVANSSFNLNGNGDGYSHSIYTGQIKKLVITQSRFQNSIVGHHVKSRAAETILLGNSFSDQYGFTSYEIDIPNGGQAVIADNYLEQASTNENAVLISYGAEGVVHKANKFVAMGNRFRNLSNGGTFILIAAENAEVGIMDNQFDGLGTIHSLSTVVKSSNNWNRPFLLDFEFSDDSQPENLAQKVKEAYKDYCPKCH